MANTAADEWGQGVPVDDTTGAQDQWGVGAPVNENDVGAFGSDQAADAIKTYAPGATITSEGRTPQHDAAVGGVPDSMHVGDQAVDVVLPQGMTADQFRAKLVAQGYPITEFINEGNHVHWGWGAKGGQAPGQDPWGVGQPVAGNLPQEGVLPGKVTLNPELAPDVPKGAPRPLAPGEYVQNPDGSWSSEISATVTDKALNKGRPTIIPTLWLVGGKPVRVSEDQAVDYAVQSGLQWRSYPTMDQAERASNARETAWQGLGIQGATRMPPLWKGTLTPEQNASIDALKAAGKQAAEGATAAPAATWWDTIKAVGKNAWPEIKSMAGGIAQAFGEHPESLAPEPNIPLGAQEQEAMNAPLAPARTAAGQQMAKAGADLYESAQAEIKANMPNLDGSSAKKIAYLAASGTLQILPVLALGTAGAVTKNPALIGAATYGGAAIMGSEAAASKYAEARATGRTPDEAAMDAGFTGLINGAMATVNLGAVWKPGQTFLGKTLQSAATFGFASVATEALQVGYDRGLINPNMSLAEAMRRLEDAGIIGVLQGAFLGGGHAALESAVNRFMAATPKPQPARAAQYGPPQRPPPTVTADEITQHAKSRLDAINLAASGDPNAVAPGPDGKMKPAPVEKRYLTPAERQERDFLQQNISDPAALARGYGARMEPAVAPEPPPQTAAPEPPAATGEPAIPAAGPLQAQIRTSLGLDRPGRPPAVDEWGTGVPVTPPPAPAPAAAAVESGGIERRVVAPDVAVTSTGREVPVHYAVVEAAALVPSQTQEGNVNPNYPQELQPRDRTRAVSQAQVATIAQNINPRLLDKSPNASDGAPIVAPSGVVESGNGRTLAIQRAYEQNMQSAFQYRQYLLEQGYPVEGMNAPMLVRVRTDPMTPEDRQAFVREANQAGQLGYSSTERAMTDASAMPDGALELYRGGDIDAAQNRPFVRAFMDRAVSANEHAGMVTPDGSLSQEAIRRVRAALLAKAYADPDLVGAIVESQDNNIKAIGGALTDAAGEWARMRSAASSGEIPAAMDQTGNLLAAVKLIDRARADGRNVAEFVNQRDIFSGETVPPLVEGWLRLMFRDTSDWTKPVGREKLADALRYYVQEAQKSSTGPNLLGLEAVNPGEILAAAKARQYGGPEQPSPGLRFGEDAGIYGPPGTGPRLESPEAGGGPGAPEGRTQGSENQLGRYPVRFAFEAKTIPGTAQALTAETHEFLKQAGADHSSAASAVGALANYVRDRGRNYGVETLGWWGRDYLGKIGAVSDNAPKFVNFRGEVAHALRDPAQRIISVHNHPSSWGPSPGDVGSLAYPGHAAMVVVAHDGHWFIHSLAATLSSRDNAAARELSFIAEQAASRTELALSPLVRGGRLTGDEAMGLHSRLIAEALDAAGITNYLSSKPASHSDPYIQAVIDQARKDAADVAIQTAGHGKIVVPTRRGDGLHQPARPMGFGEAVARLSGEPEPQGQRAAGQGGEAQRPAAAPGPYRKPFQPRLLEDENRYERERPPFYSQLTRSVQDLKLNRAPAKDWLGVIDNFKQKGVKNEEVELSGVREWLKEQPGPVTKDQVLEHLRENEVQVQEVAKGGEVPAEAVGAISRWLDEKYGEPDVNAEVTRDDLASIRRGDGRAIEKLESLGVPSDLMKPIYDNIGQGATKFASYTLPGGQNYRELLLTLPPKTELPPGFTAIPMDGGWGVRFPDGNEIGGWRTRDAAIRAQRRQSGSPLYEGSHFEEPNVLAHVRSDDRAGPNGEKVLHVAEFQSDWAKGARKSGLPTRSRNAARH